jgi:signal transduction histidine kinase
MVRGSARHLLELINDVLDISKIEAGQIETQFRMFDLVQSLIGTMSSITHPAKAKGLTLRLEQPDRQCPIYSDQRRIEQILLNLLSNAVKFTDSGEVVVTLTLADTPSADHFVRVDVIDTGIGILLKDIDSLFQPFNRIQGAVSRPGTGLGLAICKRLAELLGGHIEVESEAGRGSRFSLLLPRASETRI